jgi:alkylresorcinol/alkylpyrone synthase
MPFIVATSTGFPAQYYPQKVLAAALRKFFFAMELDFDVDQIDRFFSSVKIEGRYFALPIDSLLDPPKMQVTTSKSLEISLDIAETTIIKLLEKANLQPQDISLITSVSLTPAVPSLDARLMSRIPFSPTIKRMPINGVGCMGGAIGISRVADYLQGHPKEAAVLFAVELSSALWQGSLQGDLISLIRSFPENPAAYSDIIMNIITAALFGDGCGAVLMVGRDHPLAKPGLPQIIDNRSFLTPNTVELMGLELVDNGFRNILRPEVSDYVKKGLQPLIHSLLSDHNLDIESLYRWILHPGGPKIIDTIEAEFGLDSRALQLSRDTLTEIGNISSGTVLYMLDKILSGEHIPADSYGLMVAMGPGFSQEAILLKWE